MKRVWRAIVLLVVCVLILGFALDARWDWHIRKEQEDAYQAVLRSYSNHFKSGSTRKDVEGYLRARSVTFQQRSAESDLFLVGKGTHDWVCSEKYDYLVFHFAPAKQGEAWKAQDEDILTRIDLHFEGKCL
jgi:hypothetical protein